MLDAGSTSVVIGVLLSNSGSWLQAHSIAGALPLAVERINADSSLLPGRTLRFEWRDSGCSPSVALQALGSLDSGGQVDAVIGPACSVACEPTGYLTAGVCFFVTGM